jgi:Fic family protein
MEDLFNYYERMKLELHPLLLAADMHYKLVTIHPFIDGNGRTSRLLMNLIAYQFGNPMINISGSYESRMGYYKALEINRESSHQEAFREFILKEAIKSLKDWIKWVG